MARAVTVVSAALLLHAALLLVVPGRTVPMSLAIHSAASGAVREAPAAGPSELLPAEVVLWEEPSLPVTTPALALGPADVAGLRARHPAPDSEVDRPGRRAAAAGSSSPGRAAVSDRRDRAVVSDQIWNSEAANWAVRRRTAAVASTPESITRDPGAGFDDRRSHRGSRSGDGARALSSTGEPGGRGDSELAIARWRDADPLFDAGERVRPRRARRRSGADEEARASANRGPLASEATALADRARDDMDSAGRSASRDPHPFELSRTGAGGARGAGAGEGDGRGTGGQSDREGSALLRAPAERGAVAAAVRARRHHPYFRELYRRVDEQVRYPLDLKLNLEQGEVVLSFVLDAGGHITQLQVDKPSGFQGFDQEAVRAFREAAPFGRPPAELAGESGGLRVVAPYRFANPLIR